MSRMEKRETHRQALGRWGEAEAAKYLVRLGYSILGRNVRTSYGELDLVAQAPPESIVVPGEKPVIVFVEVKTRATENFGMPEQAVNDRKREHLVASALAYMQAHSELDCGWRIDVIAIRRIRKDQEPEIVHFENAVT